MHPSLDTARLEIKLADYATGGSAALKDAALLPRTQEHRRILGSRMMSIRREDLKKTLPAGSCHISRKVDGEFSVLIHHEGGAFLLNPGGTVRVGLPCIAEASRLLTAAGIKRAMVASELYFVRIDGKRSRVHDVGRAARQPDSLDDLEALRLAVFDILEVDGKPHTAGTLETFKWIEKVFSGGTKAHPVEGRVISRPEEAENVYQTWVEKEGSEGVVIRSDAAGFLKVKPLITIDAAVVGFTESTADRKGMLHDVLVALMRPDGSFQLLGRVGGGFTEDERKGFLADFKDMVAESNYAEVNSDHVAYSMIRPEWVIELTCLDLVSRSTRDQSIDRMVLSWGVDASLWDPLRRLPLASMIAPQFVRRRDDKTVRVSDLPLRQVSDIVEVTHADRDARTLTQPKSEILRRNVYTKVFKGATMVRKLVMWKTNKEAESTYPTYVVHFTDFSPARKTPLEREIRISSSKEQIDQLYADLTKEYIVKGWGPAT